MHELGSLIMSDLRKEF